MPNLLKLQSDIGYTFTNKALLQAALTHASFSASNNQRMEYLGDALLGFVISDLLYKKHFDRGEGDLTRLRAHLVCKKTLGGMAKKLELFKYIRLGKSFNRTDRLTENMHADTFEALIAAVYLDGGYGVALRVVEACYITFYAPDYDVLVQKDSKTGLQEFCQKNQYALPKYTVTEQNDAGRKRFFVEVTLEELRLNAHAYAVTKREAQRLAAGELICQLEKKGLLDHE